MSRDKQLLILGFLAATITGCASNPPVLEEPYRVPQTGGVSVDFVTDTISVSGPGVLRIFKVRNAGCKDTMVLEKIADLKATISFEKLRRPDITERRFTSRLQSEADIALLFSYSYYDSTESERCTVPIAYKLNEHERYEIRFTNNRRQGKCIVTAKPISPSGLLGGELKAAPYPFACKEPTR